MPLKASANRATPKPATAETCKAQGFGSGYTSQVRVKAQSASFPINGECGEAL
ncbi:Uncharacterised protein [Oligella urethralis]|uniref:Uncharacterized protein n=1 Tax=Oligella urethralis TaxID=90245 RepID=A0A2X1UP57_9BURK|nr:Uncharacterised protein [Oligella urethralis]SUA65491.1 Uncharacterised protein [Oligella urethralis]